MIQFARGTSSVAASSNSILSAGQPFFETDTNKLKIGNGTASYNDLPYIGGSGGKKYATVVVGTSTAGYTADQVDFLCDGVDDQVEIQAAINKMYSSTYPKYGEIQLLPGNYEITSHITLGVNYRDRIWMHGSGAGTTISRSNSGADVTPENSIIYLDNGEDSVYLSDLTLESDSGCCVYNNSVGCNIYNVIFRVSAGTGLFLSSTYASAVHDCRFIGSSYSSGIAMHLGSTDANVSNNLISSVQTGVALANTNSVLLVNNRITDTSIGVTNVSNSGNTSNARINNNYIEARNIGLNLPGLVRSSIIGNYIFSDIGIEIIQQGSFIASSNVISGNYLNCRSSAYSSTSTAGIDILDSSASTITICGNFVYGFYTGLQLKGQKHSVIGNSFSAGNLSADGRFAIKSTARYSSIIGNIFEDDIDIDTSTSVNSLYNIQR